MLKKIRKYLASIVTALIVLALFALIFISFDMAEPTKEFFLEIGIIYVLVVLMKIFWYEDTEEKRKEAEDLKREKENYYKIVDDTVDDSNDLDLFLAILNKENREFYVTNHLGSRTPKNLSIKNKWICFWHPSYRKLTAEEIGQIRYDKLRFKYMRKADKIRPIKSSDLMALSDSKLLYDSKNHLGEVKRVWQIATTIISLALTTALGFIAVKEIMLNWVNVFRYVLYLADLALTIGMTIISANKQTAKEMFDWYSRLKFILDKYATYKNRGGSNDNELNHVGKL